jgi:hypothetical protein
MGSTGAMNESGSTYVVWSWDAGSSTVTNTAGSITSQVRANASAGSRWLLLHRHQVFQPLGMVLELLLI